MGDYLRCRLLEDGWQVLNQTPLPVVCFSHPKFEHKATLMGETVTRLREEQLAWISKTRLRGEQAALRACVTNFNTAPRDVDQLVDGLKAVISRL